MKSKSRHSLQRQPIEKLQQRAFRPNETVDKAFGSGEESREEFSLSFQSHRNTIRGHHNPAIPPWDARVAPPAEADLRLNSQKVIYNDRQSHRDVHPVETSSQWDEYSAQSGGSRQRRNGKSKNIWSLENQTFQTDSDSSLYSAPTNPPIGTFPLGTLNESSQRNLGALQQSHDGNIRELSDSMYHLNFKGMKDDNNTVGVSTSSVTTYSSNTVPGVVGASSGSTGGSSFTGQHYRSNHTGHQQSQSIMNSGAKVFYPKQYQTHQKRAPPGFQPHQKSETAFNSSTERKGERNFMYPKDGISSFDSNSYSNRQHRNKNHIENSKKRNGKREERNGRERNYFEDGVSNREKGDIYRKNRSKEFSRPKETKFGGASDAGEEKSNANPDAIHMIMNPQAKDFLSSGASLSSSNTSALVANRLPLDRFDGETSHTSLGSGGSFSKTSGRAILPSMNDIEVESLREKDDDSYFSDDDEECSYFVGAESSVDDTATTNSKKKDWLLRMNRRLTEIPIGDLDPSTTPISAIMNAWAKTKSSNGASMVEKWLDRAQEEFNAGNTKVVPTNKMFTMAVDAWAKSGEGVSAAQRAEAILQHMNKQYQATGLENLRPTTGIFNAVINAWARSKEKIAPSRAEQILKWMDNLHKTNPSIKPDKYTFNTVIHAYAKSGGLGAARKAQELLNRMHVMYQQGNNDAKPDTITYNVVINSLAKSGGKDAAREAEKLLTKMHQIYENGDVNVKPNVVTYGAVIDAYAKSGEKYAAARADALLAKMIHLHQMDPSTHFDLSPNTYVFNTVINAHAKSKEHDAASKAEEMLLAMNRLHLQGLPNLKPDAFTYTAVIDAWAKSGYRGAAARADQLLDTMESKYLAGDVGLKPNTFTYNAVINALAKSGEPSAAARAERVLHNMVNRHKHGASEDVKPTTINFNSVSRKTTFFFCYCF
jgi:hypothetical protein